MLEAEDEKSESVLDKPTFCESAKAEEKFAAKQRHSAHGVSQESRLEKCLPSKGPEFSLCLIPGSELIEDFLGELNQDEREVNLCGGCRDCVFGFRCVGVLLVCDGGRKGVYLCKEEGFLKDIRADCYSHSGVHASHLNQISRKELGSHHRDARESFGVKLQLAAHKKMRACGFKAGKVVEELMGQPRTVDIPLWGDQRHQKR